MHLCVCVCACKHLCACVCLCVCVRLCMCVLKVVSEPFSYVFSFQTSKATVICTCVYISYTIDNHKYFKSVIFSLVVLSGTSDNADFLGFLVQGRVMADGTTATGTFTDNGDDQQTVCTGDVSITTHIKTIS